MAFACANIENVALDRELDGVTRGLIPGCISIPIYHSHVLGRALFELGHIEQGIRIFRRLDFHCWLDVSQLQQIADKISQRFLDAQLLAPAIGIEEVVDQNGLSLSGRSNRAQRRLAEAAERSRCSQVWLCRRDIKAEALDRAIAAVPEIERFAIDKRDEGIDLLASDSKKPVERRRVSSSAQSVHQAGLSVRQQQPARLDEICKGSGFAV